jgi:hypothetical protein
MTVGSRGLRVWNPRSCEVGDGNVRTRECLVPRDGAAVPGLSLNAGGTAAAHAERLPFVARDHGRAAL